MLLPELGRVKVLGLVNVVVVVWLGRLDSLERRLRADET